VVGGSVVVALRVVWWSSPVPALREGLMLLCQIHVDGDLRPGVGLGDCGCLQLEVLPFVPPIGRNG